jgi:hypothetical protein
MKRTRISPADFRKMLPDTAAIDADTFQSGEYMRAAGGPSIVSVVKGRIEAITAHRELADDFNFVY